MARGWWLVRVRAAMAEKGKYHSFSCDEYWKLQEAIFWIFWIFLDLIYLHCMDKPGFGVA